MSTLRNTTIKGFALGVITGTTLTAGAILLSAPPANAAPNVNSAERVVCLMLDADPTFPGVMHAAAVLVQEAGVTAYQAGQFIAMSVEDMCPEHTGLLLDFIAEYSQGNTSTTANKIGGKIS